MKYQAYSRTSPWKRECEDSYAINTAAATFAVFDGVTPMDRYRDKSGHNGAFIASNLFKRHFEQWSGNQLDLSEEMAAANRKLQEAMQAEEKWDLSVKYQLWSTCGVAAHVAADAIHIVQVGDCMVLAMDKQGSVTFLTPDTVEGITERVMARLKADRRKGLQVPDLSTDRSLHEYLRSFANTPGGYSVANGMDEMRHYIHTCTLDPASIRYLLLVSDGMFHPQDRPEQLLDRLLNEGFEAYTRSLEQFELTGGRRPDDKTAILLEI